MGKETNKVTEIILAVVVAMTIPSPLIQNKKDAVIRCPATHTQLKHDTVSHFGPKTLVIRPDHPSGTTQPRKINSKNPDHTYISRNNTRTQMGNSCEPPNFGSTCSVIRKLVIRIGYVRNFSPDDELSTEIIYGDRI